jgi:hypothetical protein
MTTELTYRLHEPVDIPGIAKLWQEDSGWGELTPDKFQQWYVDTPYEQCMITVAVDNENTVLGQGVATPTRLWFRGRELKIQKNSAPLLHKSIRIFSTQHPILRMYNFGKAEAISRGYSLTYAFPNHALRPLLERFVPTLQLAPLGCVGVQLASFEEPIAGDTSVHCVRKFGRDYHELWFRSTLEFPMRAAIVRSPSWLRYKFGDKLVLEVRKSNGALIGYAIFNESTGLMLDCLAGSMDQLRVVFEHCLHWLAKHRPELGEVKAMRTPILAPLLDALGFTARDFQFLVGYEILDSGLAENSFNLNEWHVMPGD